MKVTGKLFDYHHKAWTTNLLVNENDTDEDTEENAKYDTFN